MGKHTVSINVNGAERSLSVDSPARLIDILRDDLGMKSVKEGCGTGDCGICAVMLDGRLVNSCLTLAATCDGKRVVTLEGTLQDPAMRKIQESFMVHNGAQCGFCTPAMLLASWDLSKHSTNPSEEEIKTAISGVLCRCTGYYQIIEAIKEGCEKKGER